jgi:shikimate kinase
MEIHLTPRLVFLIGYRGTGKTAVARLLADKLGWRYTDADELLERHAGKTIAQIFADEGEAGFRDREAALLGTLAHGQNEVIATGGGVILRADNRASLRAGKIVWLTAPAEVLWDRMQQDATTSHRRPNLAQGGLAEVNALLGAREPLYAACADWSVDTTSKSAEEVAQAIFDWLAQ